MNSKKTPDGEVFLRKEAGEYFEVYSAGFDPKPIPVYHQSDAGNRL